MAIEDVETLERQLLVRSPRFRQMVAEALEEYQAGQAIPADEFWEKVLGEEDGA